MRELLPLLTQPSRYLGIEQGAVRKDKASVTLHAALCFPDLYEVGMSHLGQKILYGILNDRPGWWVERVYEPDGPACATLRSTGTTLATLESDTPLNELDYLGFSITHELCYTDVLNVLDLGGIPLRTKDRPEDMKACPLICAGGGAALTAEPMAPFLDCVVLGDGEETMVELFAALEAALNKGTPRTQFLREICHIPGIYVPSLFEEDGTGRLVPVAEDIPQPRRRIVADLESTCSPTTQVVPLATVHNRLSIEIARGCTRGCRFCNAGYVYRPSRERSVDTVRTILSDCIKNTGFDEISFLALSAGDYSALKHLSLATLDRCSQEQISLSLPSLRVGSIDDEIMDRMSQLRRTGVTLAPEAGSQRLRDVINKGVTEEQLITHVQKLLEYGWRQVKLYFMIGLPTETDEDLLAIVDLCRKVRYAGGPGAPKLAVTAALSPFVPKPFTPFQWEDQISLAEIDRRVHIVLSEFKKIRGLTLRWHDPKVSHLEGILSRAGRNMADVVEGAFRKGAILTGWKEYFRLEPWLETLAEHGFEPETCIRGQKPGSPLPWSHISGGVSEDFLLRELAKAREARVTEDCRYHGCSLCGACDKGRAKSLLAATPGYEIHNRLVYPERDQVPNSPARDEQGRLILRDIRPEPPKLDPALIVRAVSLRVWHTKREESAFLSQLELQAVLDRTLRRADIPMAFSQGFHPMPLLSFGRALPVGMESLCEWFSVTLRERLDEAELTRRLNACLPRGMRAWKVEEVAFRDKARLSEAEDFALRVDELPLAEVTQAFRDFLDRETFLFARETKKGVKTTDVRRLVKGIDFPDGNCGESGAACGELVLHCSWKEEYLSPFHICQAVLGPLRGNATLTHLLHIVKKAQYLG